MRRVSLSEFERRRTDHVTLAVLRLVKSYEYLHTDVLEEVTAFDGFGPGDRLDPDLALRVDKRVDELFREALQFGIKIALFSPDGVTRVVAATAGALTSAADDDVPGGEIQDPEEQ